MAKICYNCGKELSKMDKTKEHVPAQNLYEGLGDDFKKNRITVPACYACNNLYSKIDHEIRDAIAIKSDDPEQMANLIGKGVRSILNHSNWRDRTYIDADGNVTAVDFSYADLRQLHIKNFKALFFRKYGFPVPNDFVIEIIADGDEALLETAQVLHDYILHDKGWEVSGHPDIFKFILKDITPANEKDIIYESGEFDKLVGVAGLLVYHDDMGAIVVASRKDFVESCKPQPY